MPSKLLQNGYTATGYGIWRCKNKIAVLFNKVFYNFIYTSLFSCTIQITYCTNYNFLSLHFYAFIIYYIYCFVNVKIKKIFFKILHLDFIFSLSLYNLSYLVFNVNSILVYSDPVKSLCFFSYKE